MRRRHRARCGRYCGTQGGGAVGQAVAIGVGKYLNLGEARVVVANHDIEAVRTVTGVGQHVWCVNGCTSRTDFGVGHKDCVGGITVQGEGANLLNRGAYRVRRG